MGGAACYCLGGMSNGDDKKHSRPTQRFDTDKLAAITKAAGGTWHEPVVPATEDEANAVLAASRTSTVHDPMTMALLAEAARSQQTLEVDPAAIEAAIADAEASEAAAKATAIPRERTRTHPNLKRRVP